MLDLIHQLKVSLVEIALQPLIMAAVVVVVHLRLALMELRQLAEMVVLVVRHRSRDLQLLAVVVVVQAFT
jgi:hypothetical protein